jgi:colanic acid/amylovoran biosynthesis glycosyltransferase
VASTARELVQAVAGPQRRRVPTRDRILLAPLISRSPDIIHFQFSGIAVAYSDLLAELRPAKLVVSCRGTAERVVRFRDPTRGSALAAMFAKMDLIHCVSDEIASIVVELGAPPERILVNRPAVPSGQFTPIAARRGQHDGSLRVLSIGRLSWAKGFDDGLRAIAAYRATGADVSYRIGGEGDEREKLLFLRHQLALDEQVTLLGVCDQDQVRQQLEWADVLLLPSLSEGISNVALEAMASGLPVIATDCGGMPEVIDDGANGYLVSIGDTASMAQRLAELADDPDLRQRIGSAAIDRIQTAFDLERQITTFARAYDDLAANR